LWNLHITQDLLSGTFFRFPSRRFYRSGCIYIPIHPILLLRNYILHIMVAESARYCFNSFDSASCQRSHQSFDFLCQKLNSWVRAWVLFFLEELQSHVCCLRFLLLKLLFSLPFISLPAPLPFLLNISLALCVLFFFLFF